jgi:hypothetical protein
MTSIRVTNLETGKEGETRRTLKVPVFWYRKILTAFQ